MASKPASAILPHALHIPGINKLAGKRVVLASKSPRRKEILQIFGLAPEVIPSNFPEDLSALSFDDIHEYPVATATQKAVEVYERLVRSDPENGPDLVIGADTVVLTHAQPVSSDIAYSELPSVHQELLEKPENKADNLRMLQDLNGSVCEVVTGVSLVFPVLTSPGFSIRAMDERSLVYFSDNASSLLKAYVDSGEGLNRAGGFAIQGMGGLLIRKIEGDYHNVVGFPAASFFRYLDLLVEEDDDFLEV
ncbi:Maf/Ham1 [Multifurca ochricompacta]|uniref:Maf/Ham1 n=1 Tax=Multifurca ochricompacta TaxID=376703 RepID=A0AAD4LYU5_9AGAM|nr:Maf/Ham1 [Multifurca ochricompacta]